MNVTEPSIRPTVEASPPPDVQAHRMRNASRVLGVWLAVFLLLVMSAILSPASVQPGHLLDVLRQAGGLGIVATGQTLVILIGGLDLSVGAQITMVDVVASNILNGSDQMLIPVVLLCLALCAVVGLVNGLIIVGRRVPPFIVTLGMLSVVQGATFVYTGGAPRGATSPTLRFIGSGHVGPIPTALFFWVVVAGVGLIVLHRTVYGRYLYAIGGNSRAARLSGISVGRIILSVYIVSALLAGVAGLVLAGYIGTGSLTLGDSYTLNSVAAAVVGGTAFEGGRGGLGGTIAGALLLQLLFSLLAVLNMPYSGQLIAQGLIIAGAVALYTSRKGGGGAAE